MNDAAKTYPWSITPEQLDMIRKHVAQFLAKGCWVCEENDWLILPKLIGEKPYDPDAAYIVLGENSPKIRLTCKNCGNVVYFSADKMNLFNDTGPNDE